MEQICDGHDELPFLLALQPLQRAPELCRNQGISNKGLPAESYGGGGSHCMHCRYLQRPAIFRNHFITALIFYNHQVYYSLLNVSNC